VRAPELSAKRASSRRRAPIRAAAFYCMSSDVYFLGAVGMINSLRLLGHREPIYLLDLGLKEEQRELLAPEVRFVEAPSGAQPWLLKTVAPLAHPAEVMVLIDADMIATRPLTELIERAADGNVVAFQNDIDRFVPEWGELLDLGELRRQPYLCSALVAMGPPLGEDVLRLMEDRQRRIEFERTFFAANVADYALLYLDQDVLNAILASRVEPDHVVSLDHRLAPVTPFDGLEVIDVGALRCVHRDGTEPYLLHHLLPAKPWLRPMHDGAYSQLLKRLLVGPDLAVRVPDRMIPLRMRRGRLGYVERKRVDAAVKIRWHVGIALHRAWTRLLPLWRQVAGSRH
jgi:hypothetical protein